MARTAGAISNVSVSLGDLSRIMGFQIGDEHKGRPVVISKKWLDMQQKPCEMVTITAEELERLNAGLGDRVASVEGTHAVNTPAPVVVRARMEDIPDL
jgi:hypothetical protein